MRIIILSITLLFCAFSAQSQVLKSAGVWYFLDVDSMTARPAVLPNGTELAYVVGTKTVYYWNRATSTWTAYGSTFGRDSIYFDSSIVGSGTVSDPWGVDSTLFATIAGVGDSIAAALGDYVEIADTAAMLINYPSTTGYGIIDGGKVWRADTTSPNGLATRLFARGLSTTIASGYLATSNGTNLVARNLFDNNTAVSILNSKPFQLGQWTTAGRPAGVNGYVALNTTTRQHEWYDSEVGSWRPLAMWDKSAQWIYYNNPVVIGAALATVYPTNRLTVAGTSTIPGIMLTGQGVGGGATDNSQGVLLALGFNGDGNRQLWIGDNTGIGSAVKSFFRYQTGGLMPTVDATTGTNVRQPLNIGTNTSNVAIGYEFGGVTGSDLPASKLSVNGSVSIGTDRRTVAADANGLSVMGKSLFDDNIQLNRTKRFGIGLPADPNYGLMLSSIGFRHYSFSIHQLSFTSDGSTFQDRFYWDSGGRAAGNVTTLPTQLGQNIWFGNALIGWDTVVNAQALGLGIKGNVSVGTINQTAKFHVKGSGTTTGQTLLLEDSAGADILTITDNKTIQANAYGTGTKEASNLSKTQSNYIAGFATDGTVLDLNLDTIAKTEKYYTVTSTSSPQTLSNDFPDNLINQGGTQATFTLNFPASPRDGQLLYITYNNAISVLTLDGNGNTIVGSAVTTGVAGSQRKFKFYTGIGWIKLY